MMARHLLMGAALLVAAGFALFGDNSPNGAAVAMPPRANAANAVNAVNMVNVPNAAAVAARAAPAGAASRPAAVTILRLDERAALAGPGGTGGGAFASHDWTPPPLPPPPPPPPPPPSAPPLPFTFIGKAVSGGQWEVFLARGADTLIVRDKMVVDGV